MLRSHGDAVARGVGLGLFVCCFVCWGELGERVVVNSVFVYLVVFFMLGELEGGDSVGLLGLSF